jgi:ATP-dependent Lon protease
MKAAATAVAASVALARLAAPTSPRWWPLVLEGPPGIGKTYFAERLGELFEVPVHRLGFGHATASFALGGLDAQYSTGGPGWLARTVGLSKHADPLIVLDEIDKCARASNSDPLTPLYSLWDGTAEHFLDDGLRVPLNLSRVRWIATCNDASALPEALLSRCLVVPVAAPSSEQSIRIASRIYVRLLRSAPWGQAFLSVLPDAIAARLAGLSPRDIEKCLYQALGHAALAGRRVLVEEDLPLPDGPRRRKLGFLP